MAKRTAMGGDATGGKYRNLRRVTAAPAWRRSAPSRCVVVVMVLAGGSFASDAPRWSLSRTTSASACHLPRLPASPSEPPSLRPRPAGLHRVARVARIVPALTCLSLCKRKLLVALLASAPCPVCWPARPPARPPFVSGFLLVVASANPPGLGNAARFTLRPSFLARSAGDEHEPTRR